MCASAPSIFIPYIPYACMSIYAHKFAHTHTHEESRLTWTQRGRRLASTSIINAFALSSIISSRDFPRTDTWLDRSLHRSLARLLFPQFMRGNSIITFPATHLICIYFPAPAPAMTQTNKLKSAHCFDLTQSGASRKPPKQITMESFMQLVPI